jgi:hypothetical protein
MRPERFRSTQRLSRVAAFLVVSLAMTFGSMQLAHAASDVSAADLQAATRAIGFLQNLPHDGSIVIGIVYATQSEASKALATQIAATLASLPGPNKSVIRTKLVSIDSLAQTTERLDALFLVPGISSEGSAIGDAIRRRRIISISNDPSCLDSNCCVLMVRAKPDVEIVLNTVVADAVGANFSTVFAMIVKRR